MKASQVKQAIEIRVKYHLPEDFEGPEFEQCKKCTTAFFEIEEDYCKDCKNLIK